MVQTHVASEESPFLHGRVHHKRAVVEIVRFALEALDLEARIHEILKLHTVTTDRRTCRWYAS
jgi:hypothetical protein